MNVYVAGHTGLVGAAACRALRAAGHRVWQPPRRMDLRLEPEAQRVMDLASAAGVDAVVLAAARVGGIGANSAFPVQFLADNLLISTHVILHAHRVGIPRLVNLGSSCIYPRDAEQPMREEALLTGSLEPTNEPYALAKISALKLVCAMRRQYGARYVSLMPCNLYGPGDHFHPEHSHVIPAMVCKLEQARRSEAPTVTLWGTGSPLREFLHVDDLARAIVLVLAHYDGDLWLNAGSNEEIRICDLAEQVADATGYHGTITWDASKPDGTPRKKVDCSRLRALGWEPEIQLGAGLREVVAALRARNPDRANPVP